MHVGLVISGTSLCGMRTQMQREGAQYYLYVIGPGSSAGTYTSHVKAKIDNVRQSSLLFLFVSLLHCLSEAMHIAFTSGVQHTSCGCVGLLCLLPFL